MQEIIVADYSRVSDPSQYRNKDAVVKASIPLQQKAAEEECAKRGWQLRYRYSEPGISGELLEERTALQQLLRDAEAQKFHVVIVSYADRLARDVALFLDIIKRLEQRCGIPVLNLSNPRPFDPLHFDPDADDSRIFMHVVEGLFGQIDQRQRTRLLSAGRRKQIEAGRFIGSRPPYGYREDIRMNENGRIERSITPSPTYWVLELLPRLVLEEGLSDREIAKALDETYHAPTATGGKWQKNSVRNILKNRFYAGVQIFGLHKKPRSSARIKADSSNILSAPHHYPHPWTQQTFDAIQEARARRRTAPPRTHASSSPVAGILRCGYCGFSMQCRRDTRQTKKGPDYFICGTYGSGGHNCRPNRTPVSAILACIREQLDMIVQAEARDPEVFYAAVMAPMDTRKEEEAQKIMAGLHQERAGLDRQETTLDDRLLDGTISSEKYKELSARVCQRRETLEAHIADVHLRLETISHYRQTRQQTHDLLCTWQGLAQRIDRPLAEWPLDLVRQVRHLLAQLYRDITVESAYEPTAKRWSLAVTFAYKEPKVPLT